MIRVNELTPLNRSILQRCYDLIPTSVPLSLLEEQMAADQAFLYEQWLFSPNSNNDIANNPGETSCKAFFEDTPYIGIGSKENPVESISPRLESMPIELIYVGIVQVCPNGLKAVVGAGVKGKENRLEIKEQFEFLKVAMDFYGKDRLRLMGRVGWYKKYLKGLGFEVNEWFWDDNNRALGNFDYIKNKAIKE